MSFVNKSGKRFVPKIAGRRMGRSLKTGPVNPEPAKTPQNQKEGEEETNIEITQKDEPELKQNDEEILSDLEELKDDKPANDVFKPLATTTSPQAIKISAPTQNEAFTQPLNIQAPQRRLNSLTTPTQLMEQVNKSANTSRRNSVISSRRPSIVRTSRRGSAVVVDDVAIGGVITGNNNSNSESTKISMGEPIRIPLKQRRKSSFSAGIKRRRSSSVRLNDDVSSVVKQRVVEAVKNVKSMKSRIIRDNAQNISVQKEVGNGNGKETETERDKSREVEREKRVDNNEVEPDVINITKREKEAQYKWMMSKTQGKLVKVDLSLLEVKKDDEEDVKGPKMEDSNLTSNSNIVVSASPIKKDYNLNFKINDVKQLRGLRFVDDAHLTQHIKIDEEKMSMGDLCKPFFPIGEVSKDYEKAVEGERKRIERQKKLAHERRMARRYRLNEMEINKLQSQHQEGNNEDQKAKIKEMMERDISDSQNKAHNVPLLQIQNGQVVYSQESTLVNRHGEDLNNDLERIEENPYENIVTSNTYSKKKQTLKWTPQETAELFKAVSLWGTDFSLIAQLFPYRNRKQIKAKFVLEEKRHPHLVEFALLRKLPVDIDEYSGKSGKQFKTLDEYNEELRRVKEKHESELKTMALAKERALVEDRESQHASAVVKPRSRKAVIAEFRKNEEVVGSLD